MRFQDVEVGTKIKFLESCGCIKRDSTGTKTPEMGVMIDRLLGNFEIFIRHANPLVKLGETMQLRVKEDSIRDTLGNTPKRQLVKLLEPSCKLPRKTIGYLVAHSRFVVIAGAPFGEYDIAGCTLVEILKSGTLVLEITL